LRKRTPGIAADVGCRCVILNVFLGIEVVTGIVRANYGGINIVIISQTIAKGKK
jgi:hypothetical protein